jgi:hypothetical protein
MNAFGSKILNNGLVAYYPFNGNATDESGIGQHGIVSGATLTNNRLGSANSAFYFDGVTNVVSAQSITIPTGNASRTLSAWVKFPTLKAGSNQIVGWGNFVTGGDQCSYMQMYQSRFRFVFFDNYIAGPANVVVNTWYHVVGTYDGSVARLYVNGAEVANSTINLKTTATDIFIGSDYTNNPANALQGVIDDVRIYNRTLSVDEIQLLYKLQPADSWQPMTTTGAPSARQAYSAVWTGSEMIVWGGSTALSAGAPVNTGGRYDPITDSWSPTAVNTSGAPTARHGHAAVWTGSEMIVWGGWDSTTTISGARYIPATDTWSSSPTSTIGAPSARFYHTAVWTGSEIIIWGGITSAATTLNDGGRYNPVTNTWSVTPMSTVGAPSGREAPSSIWTGKEMIVWGGWDGTMQNNGGRYNPLNNTWTSGPTTINAPTARDGHAAVWTGTEMIVWGGYAGGSSDLNTGARYNPATDIWTATTSTVGAPTARDNITAVWTGSQMLIWGGQTAGVGTLNTGGRYTPYETVALTHDSWQTMSTVGAPTARSGPSAIWTGSQMIVWGGFSDSVTFLNSGGKYDPISDTWLSPPSTINAPAARSGHSAIWTGTKMIIWGGAISSGPTSTSSGGIYNPSTDTWEAVPSTIGAPTARYAHTAVWTGEEMLIWGGAQNSVTLLNSGGRYNPSTNSWGSALSTSGTPSIRSSHVAVWTGSEMIVWGGFSTNGSWIRVNTGGRYNPQLDTWGPATQTSAAPLGREGATAVWTGSEMIIWGGWDGINPPFSDGNRYDPDSNTWTGTTTPTNAPEGRFTHAGVWSGNQMIIWGGFNDASLNSWVNTGGRYTP